MILHVPALLKREQVAEARRALDRAEWVDGAGSAMGVVADVKKNHEIPSHHPVSQQIGKMIFAALQNNVTFVTRALPIRLCPPIFSRYVGGAGETYGEHTDGGLFQMPSPNLPMRGDLAATVFLASPEEYEGGELTIHDTFGSHSVKLPAGDMIVYPASSLHKVEPVTGGKRFVGFFWAQSAIRDDSKRSLLADLDRAIEECNAAGPNNPGIMRLHGVYNNLLRIWAET